MCHLCHVLQPSTQSDEHEQHGRSVEEGDRALGGPLGHGYHQHHTGVDVGDGGGQHDQDVHVGRAVSERAVRLDVEVAASEDLASEEHRKPVRQSCFRFCLCSQNVYFIVYFLLQQTTLSSPF